MFRERAIESRDCDVIYGDVVKGTSFLIFIAAAEKEVIGAPLGAKVASGKKKRTIFANELKRDRALPQSFHFFGDRTTNATVFSGHKDSILIVH